LESAWRKRWPKLRLTRIGQLTRTGSGKGLGQARGFDHFA
jgi:hypothetical protein